MYEILRDHIIASFNIEAKDFNRLLEEFLSYFGKTPEEYITKRHLELREEGLKNEKIYSLIRVEMNSTRFKAPELSERQIRRIIYG